MDVMGRVAAQNLESLLFAFGIARSDPQQQAAVTEMLVEMLGMLVADVARQGRTEQAAGATGNHGRRKYAEQRAARSGHRKTAEHGRQIDARANDGAFGVADGFRPLPAWGTSDRTVAV
jgi:hypothetical protein